MELELKLVLDAAGYFRLASALPGYAGARRLANHYFDSVDRALLSRGAMLRVRERDDGWVAGLKQGMAVRGGEFEAAEWELPLAARDWTRAVRAAGDLGILDHPVIREAFALARVPVLPYLGSLRVLRTRFELSSATVVELDLACFEDGSQDWELEVETERPESVRPFLEELLGRRGIAWREQTRTKYERFLGRLGDGRPPVLSEPRGEVEMIGEGVLVRRRPLSGPGVFATCSFRAGETVLAIEGKPVEGDAPPPGRRWIQTGRRSFVDVTGAPAASVRHSCLPACGVRAADRRSPGGWAGYAGSRGSPPDVGLAPALELVAMRPIAPGDEVTYDYALTEGELERVCLCGTAACRGLVGGWRRLPGRLRRAYRGWAAKHLLEEEPIRRPRPASGGASPANEGATGGEARAAQRESGASANHRASRGRMWRGTEEVHQAREMAAVATPPESPSS